MARSTRRLVFSLFGALLTSTLAAGQDPTSATGEDYGERIDVRAVNVETVVTDRKGNRVSGLSAADFELLVDGKPMPLEFFLEVRGGRAVAATASEGTPALPTSAEAGEPVAHNYLVFLDEVLSPIRERKAAIKKLAAEIERLGPADSMAIVASDTRGLTVLSPWTQSREELEAALDTARRRTGFMRPWEASAMEEPGSGLLEKTIAEDRAYNFGLQAQDFREMIATAAAAEQELSDVSGRKVLLLVSGRWVGFFQKADVRTGYEVIRPLTDASNRLGYTVYPVQLDAAIEHLPGADRRTEMRYGEEIRSAGLTSFLESQGPMLFAADETGGRLLKMDHAFLGKTVEDVSSYYWLGFSRFDGDGRRRTIEVRVKGKDLDVRTRSSYLPLFRQADATPAAGMTGTPGNDPATGGENGVKPPARLAREESIAAVAH